MQGGRSWTDEQLIEAVKTSKTYAEVYRKLGFNNPTGNNAIRTNIKKMNLDISHFLTRSEQQKIARDAKKTYSNEEMFSINDIDRKLIKKQY